MSLQLRSTPPAIKIGRSRKTTARFARKRKRNRWPHTFAVVNCANETKVFARKKRRTRKKMMVKAKKMTTITRKKITRLHLSDHTTTVTAINITWLKVPARKIKRVIMNRATIDGHMKISR